jgi:hypothetical protein
VANERPGPAKPPNGEFNWLAWIAVLIAVLLTIAYGLGAFR